jgi:hypothetical protein
MRASKHIEQLAGNIHFRPDEKTDERVLAEAEAALRKRTFPATKPEQMRIIIMRNPIIRIAAAAVVVIACGIGLSLWRTTGSGIALADVLAHIEQVKAFRYKWSSTTTGEYGDKPIKDETHVTVLTSQEHGSKSISEESDPNGRVSIQEFYWLPQKRTSISIWPQKKKYSRIEFDDAWAERIEKSYNDPRWTLKRILVCKHESLGRSNVDGVELEGFQTTDPNYAMDFGATQVDVKIWVDVKTELPVRSEDDVVFDRMRVQITTHDYRWDVPVDAAEFDPVIPKDYAPVAGVVVKWPALTEETAIRGLKLCLQLTGKYPENTDFPYYQWPAFQKSDTPAVMRLKEEVKGLTEDEKANRLVEATLPMRCLSRFYAGLQFDKKDPAYYGKTVTPKDADKVLMRWKVSDTEYRVIFGDLHTQSVTAEKLAELEKLLPK